MYIEHGMLCACTSCLCYKLSDATFQVDSLVLVVDKLGKKLNTYTNHPCTGWHDCSLHC